MLNKKDIIKEWQWIYENYPHFKKISVIKAPVVSETSIGDNIGHLNTKNYQERYESLYLNEEYSILLEDDSLICFYYLFSNKGELFGHNLMYIPSYNPNTEIQCFSKYLRIDYDKQGYKSITHTLVHLHVGIANTGIRFPISHLITPKDFVYIILKYIYNDNSDIIDKLLPKNPKDNVLTEEEQHKLRLIFGQISI